MTGKLARSLQHAKVLILDLDELFYVLGRTRHANVRLGRHV